MIDKQGLIDTAHRCIAPSEEMLKNGDDEQWIADGKNITQLINIALASLEAKPFGYFHRIFTDEFYQVVAVSKDHDAYSSNPDYTPLYTTPPAASRVPDDWETCQRVSEDDYVDNALRELVEDTTADNGVRVVQAVIRAICDMAAVPSPTSDKEEE